MRPPTAEIDVLWRGEPVQLRRTEAGWVSTEPRLLLLLTVLANQSWFGARLDGTPDQMLMDVLGQVAKVVAVRDPDFLTLPAASVWD